MQQVILFDVKSHISSLHYLSISLTFKTICNLVPSEVVWVAKSSILEKPMHGKVITFLSQSIMLGFSSYPKPYFESSFTWYYFMHVNSQL